MKYDTESVAQGRHGPVVQVLQVLAQHADRSRGRHIQAEDDARQEALARTVAADEQEPGTLRYHQVDGLQGAAPPYVLEDPMQLQGRGHIQELVNRITTRSATRIAATAPIMVRVAAAPIFWGLRPAAVP